MSNENISDEAVETVRSLAVAAGWTPVVGKDRAGLVVGERPSRQGRRGRLLERRDGQHRVVTVRGGKHHVHSDDIVPGVGELRASEPTSCAPTSA